MLRIPRNVQHFCPLSRTSGRELVVVSYGDDTSIEWGRYWYRMGSIPSRPSLDRPARASESLQLSLFIHLGQKETVGCQFTWVIVGGRSGGGLASECAVAACSAS